MNFNVRLLCTSIHPDIDSLEGKSIFKREATRAIALRGNSILLLYTERYHDYSLPGGGLDRGEDLLAGMIRELKEETGAKGISNISEFGIYEEYRPWYKSDFDIQHMISYCFTCSVDEELGETSLEHYELNNGMKPVWINIDEAIKHNEDTIKNSKKKGVSIEREIFLLRLIREEILEGE
nr:NUDIX hydrolase [Halobacteriovorax sp. JY17]